MNGRYPRDMVEFPSISRHLFLHTADCISGFGAGESVPRRFEPLISVANCCENTSAGVADVCEECQRNRRKANRTQASESYFDADN